MKIDIERLATDLDYWNSVAPEGAKCFIDTYFVKWDGSAEFLFDNSFGGWIESTCPWSLEQYREMPKTFTVIIKPTTPAWSGEGLPPVGVVCEYRVKSREIWTDVEIIAHDWPVAIFKNGAGNMYKGGFSDDFRPCRTEGQRKHDDLWQLVMDNYIHSDSAKTAHQVADALIAAGYRK